MTEEHIQRVIQQAIGTELAYGVNSLAREIDWQSKVRDAIRAEANALKAQRDELLRALERLMKCIDTLEGHDYSISSDVDEASSDARALIARCKETP